MDCGPPLHRKDLAEYVLGIEPFWEVLASETEAYYSSQGYKRLQGFSRIPNPAVRDVGSSLRAQGGRRPGKQGGHRACVLCSTLPTADCTLWKSKKIGVKTPNSRS